MDHEVLPAPMKTFPPATISIILAEVANGKSLISVLESNPSYPSKSIWHRWVSEDPQFSRAYVTAMQQGIAKRHGH